MRNQEQNVHIIHQKYERANKIAEKRQLSEFAQALQSIAKTMGFDSNEVHTQTKSSNVLLSSFRKLFKSNKNAKGSPRKMLQQLLKVDDTIKISSTKKMKANTFMSYVCPKKIPFVIMNTHIVLDYRQNKTIKCIFALQPQKITPDIETVFRQYVEWWNRQNEYQIHIQDDRFVILTELERGILDDKQIIDEFCRLNKLWTTDCLSISLALLGILKFE